MSERTGSLTNFWSFTGAPSADQVRTFCKTDVSAAVFEAAAATAAMACLLLARNCPMMGASSLGAPAMRDVLKD